MDSAVAELLFEGLRRIQVVTSFNVAAVVLFLWDYFITFGSEVELVWGSKWNTMKVLFLVQRYMPFADTVFLVLYMKFSNNMDTLKCQHWTTACAYLTVIGSAISEVILTLRVWAVWNRPRWLTLSLPIAFAGFWIPDLAFVHIFGKSLKFIDVPWKITGSQCFLVSADRILYLCYVNLLVWNALMLILISIPGYQHYRNGSGGTSLVTTTFRDGAVFYLYLFILSVSNIIVFQALPDGYANLFTVMERCFHSSLTSRVLLHIREHAKMDPQLPRVPVHWAEGLSEIPSDESDFEVGTSTELRETATIVIHRTVVTNVGDQV